MKKPLIKIIIIISIFVSVFLYKKLLVKTVYTIPPTYQINLDQKPEDRWKPIIQQMSPSTLLSFAQSVERMLNTIKPKLQPYIDQLIKTTVLTEEYQKEIYGIIQALHEKFGELPNELQYENLLLLNIAYSLFISCTSGIIVGEENVPYLFRNLDWPAPFLRKYTINIEWYKNNSCLFKTTCWPLIVSAHTGEKNGKFAISINARHTKDGTVVDNLKDYVNNTNDIWSVSILTRHVLQYAKDYDEAYTIFKHTNLLSPAYIILAGVKPEEGVIFARDHNKVHMKAKITKWQRYYPEKDEHTNPKNQRSPLILDPIHAQTKYIVVTNIDPDYPAFQKTKAWACKTGTCKPLLIDKKKQSYGPQYRRNTALNASCILPSTFTVNDLFKKILWIRPIKNFETIYSTVMCPAKNLLQSYTLAKL